MRLATCFAFFAITAFTQTAAPPKSDWHTAKEYADVDTTGLTAAQKAKIFQIMREEDCSCGCGMKIAQCRVEDPKCSYSKALSAKTIQAIKDGKSEDEMRKTIRAAGGPGKVLDDAITLRTEGSPVKGPVNAKITLVEFSDFQCPYCSQAIAELDQVLKMFPKDVKLVFKQFPLSEIHSQAMLASQAALAANAQGKFWPMHDRLFANRSGLTRENMLKWAKEFGCDMNKFTADMDSAETKKTIARDLNDGEKAGVEGTPTVFVNGKHYNGSLAPKAFAEILKSELKTAK